MKDEDRLQFDSYMRERAFLLHGALETRRTLDRSLLTLASGALALSFVFLDHLRRDAHHAWLMICSWGFFVACIVVVLWSFWTSISSFGQTLRDYEESLKTGEPGIKTNVLTKTTRFLNGAALIFFVGGIVTFLVFAFMNGGNIMKDDPSKTQALPTKRLIKHGATPPEAPLKPADLMPAPAAQESPAAESQPAVPTEPSGTDTSESVGQESTDN